jgi:hypothetical protein
VKITKQRKRSYPGGSLETWIYVNGLSVACLERTYNKYWGRHVWDNHHGLGRRGPFFTVSEVVDLIKKGEW